MSGFHGSRDDIHRLPKMHLGFLGILSE